MARIVEIMSTDAPELDVYTRLTEAQLKNRLNPEKAMFIAESPKVIGTALDAGLVPVSLLCERGHIETDAREIVGRLGDVPIYTAEREVLASLTGYTLTRGVLCAMLRPKAKTIGDILQGARRIAVLENIVDSTNMGAIFRSAAALGIDAVVLTPSCSDPLNRRCVRVSMGTVFQVHWAYISHNTSDWPEKGLEILNSYGFKTCAMALSNECVWIDDERLKACEKLAIVLGTEGDGLTHETVASCDFVAKIPMQHGVDSLNVAAAGALAFWELRIK
jgi:tRNA G18 (ribose-2'-O)-methylase SpoU